VAHKLLVLVSAGVAANPTAAHTSSCTSATAAAAKNNIIVVFPCALPRAPLQATASWARDGEDLSEPFLRQARLVEVPMEGMTQNCNRKWGGRKRREGLYRG